MILDLDDFHQGNHRYDLLRRLKEINPALKVTLFAVPGLGSDAFWDQVPNWCELAVHGWTHPDSYECAGWSYDRMVDAIRTAPHRFVNGWKSPGWQTSDGVYRALADHGWWVADQHLEDARRPDVLRTYFYEDDPVERWHGHVQDWGSNGLQESWEEVSARVAAASDFRFCSEALS